MDKRALGDPMEFAQNVQKQQEEAHAKRQAVNTHVQSLKGSDAVQKAIIETTKENIKHRATHEPKVEIKNFPQSSKISNLKEITVPLNQIKKAVIDNKPNDTKIVKALEDIRVALSKLPQEMPEVQFPELPEAPEDVKVNNLAELKPYFDELSSYLEKITKLELNPEITVESPETKEIDLTPITEAISSLKGAIEAIPSPEPIDLLPLMEAINGTTSTIENLRFPVANYVLPFKDSTGKDSQLQISASGGIPISNTTDSSVTSTIVANGGVVVAPVVAGMAGWTMGYYGTYATGASLTMEASFDGGLTYASVRMLQGSSGVLGYVITIAVVVNSTSYFVADIPSGATHLRVRCTAWAAPTGAINIVLAQSVERFASPVATQAVTGTFSGLKTSNTAIPAATNLGVLNSVANAAAPVLTETFQTTLSMDLSGNTRVRTLGDSTSTVSVPANAANVVVKGTPGRLCRVLVTATGVTAMQIFDNATTNSGTIIGALPANAVIGGVYDFNMPAAAGILIAGSATNPAVTVSIA